MFKGSPFEMLQQYVLKRRHVGCAPSQAWARIQDVKYTGIYLFDVQKIDKWTNFSRVSFQKLSRLFDDAQPPVIADNWVQ
jgi:hypothetical protein